MTQRLITVEEFDRMWESGVIGPEERLELIEGRLVRREMMNPPHASIMLRMTQRFQRALGDRVLVSQQLPVVVNERSKPFPDFTLVRYRDDYYAERLPIPEDVLAVIEVSDSRLRFDRSEKLRLYAKAGIPEYWIVDVKKKAIEVYRGRHDLGYAKPVVAKKGEGVAFAAFPDVVFAVDELVG
ncbi:MAG TPA: Uma2 family endonuclease [Candidatus Elarobacter sp.]|nr:Uma2 family endonuclease [Candidatus Elarobacter sp.]